MVPTPDLGGYQPRSGASSGVAIAMRESDRSCPTNRRDHFVANAIVNCARSG
jgi:hypothetical protein